MGGKRKKGGKKGNKKSKTVDEEVEFVCTVKPRQQTEQEQDGDESEHDVQDQPQEVQDQQQDVHDPEHDGDHEKEQEKEHDQERQQEQQVSNEPEGEIEHTLEPEVGSCRKRKRGPTMMRDLAKDPNTRVHVDFTFMGEAYGPGSVKLSSYLGPLVREHVPVTLETWKKITEEVKTVLWKSVQVIVCIQ